MLFPNLVTPIGKRVGHWPVDDKSIDLVLMSFAAHEVRNPGARDQLFREAARALSDEGSIVLVEHLRDGENFLAYGPGALHFYSEDEWLRCASTANLKVVKRFKITPFVGVFVLCR